MKYKTALLATLILLAGWHGLSLLIDKPFLPTPLESLLAFFDLAREGAMAKDFIISLMRVLAGTGLALIFALPLGLAMGRKKQLNRLLDPFISILYPVPKVVLLPIFVVLLGLGNAPKIFLIALIVFFQLLVVLRDAAAAVPAESLLAMRMLSASRIQAFRHLLLPWCLPDLLTALRVSMGTAVSVLFFAETFASFDGLGALILDGMERRDYAAMYGAIIALSLLGVFLYEMIGLAERRLCRWKRADGLKTCG
ncbi:ABC transporter permease [Peptococcus simiae]|uniref:ABC transporter permease n=1 Tax=Peptococcus simiae TaxID=1643805 RepID=UPI003980AA63